MRRLLHVRDIIRVINVIVILLLINIPQIAYILGYNFHTFDTLSSHEIVGTDVFFEIIEPKELAYTYKIRPAQDFGTTFNAKFSAKNVPLVPAEPSFACDQLKNSDELYGNIALVERGECSFLTKSLNVEQAGALAIIVSDHDKNNDDLYIEMIDDNTYRPVSIPAGFLLGKNGYIIRTTLERLKRRYALINLPVNLTHVPVNKFNQPPWLEWKAISHVDAHALPRNEGDYTWNEQVLIMNFSPMTKTLANRGEQDKE